MMNIHCNRGSTNQHRRGSNGFNTPLRLIWSTNVIIKARKGFWQGVRWHLALCSAAHTLWPVNLVTSYLLWELLKFQETGICLTAFCPLKRWQRILLIFFAADSESRSYGINQSLTEKEQQWVHSLTEGEGCKAHRGYWDWANTTTEIEIATLIPCLVSGT